MLHARPSIQLAEITVGCHDPARVGSFWSALFRAPLRVPMPGWFRLGPMTQGGPLVSFKPVPEDEQGRARLHLDLATDDLAGAVHTVVQLGGHDLHQVHEHDLGTAVLMADPEGNEFCLVQHSFAGVPDATADGRQGA